MAEFPILEALNLKIGFPGHQVVHGVSFQIRRGETLALVGESGCGKSLTAFAVLRLLPVSAEITGGQVIFDGVDLATIRPAELRARRGKDISLIQQEPMTSLNPVLPIGLQIGEVIRRHERLSGKALRSRVIDLLELVGISDPHRRIDEYPHNFSGGMRQRVMIATAVACNPRLLIADEPTTALDVTIQAQVMELLNELKSKLDMSILFITHDLGAVAQWADRIAVMYAGHIVEEGTVGEVIRNPAHPYTSGLLNSSVGEAQDWHYTNHRLVEIPGTVASATTEPGCKFAPRCQIAAAGCRAAPPALAQIGVGRRVACLRHGQPADVERPAAHAALHEPATTGATG